MSSSYSDTPFLTSSASWATRASWTYDNKKQINKQTNTMINNKQTLPSTNSTNIQSCEFHVSMKSGFCIKSAQSGFCIIKSAWRVVLELNLLLRMAFTLICLENGFGIKSATSNHTQFSLFFTMFRTMTLCHTYCNWKWESFENREGPKTLATTYLSTNNNERKKV